MLYKTYSYSYDSDKHKNPKESKVALIEHYKIPEIDCCDGNRTILANVRPDPDERGAFIFERKDGIDSIVRQGLVKIGGATVKYTYERQLDSEENIPLIITPGYGGIKPAYRDLRAALVTHGKPAVTFRPPRTQRSGGFFNLKHLRHPERLLAQSTAAVAKDVVERYGLVESFDKVDAVGHSMGGPAVVNAAHKKPELFRSITAVASAGLDGHNLFVLAQRMPKILSDEMVPAIRDMRARSDRKSLNDIIHYMGSNPLRTIAEGLAVGNGDIRQKVVDVGKLGVKTAALQFPSDRFFHIDKVRDSSSQLFDYYSEFTDTKANHIWPQIQPSPVAHEIVRITNLLGSIVDIEAVSGEQESRNAPGY